MASMRLLLRKLKGALAIGSIWGLATGLVGAVAGVVSGLGTGSVIGTTLVFGAGAGAAGLVLGLAFTSVLAVAEGRRTLDELTARRAAVWGFVGGGGVTLVAAALSMVATGAALPLGVSLTAIAAGAASYGAVTAGLAAATVSVAKRDERIPAPSDPFTELPPRSRDGLGSEDRAGPAATD